LRSHSLQLRLLNGRASKTTRIVNIRLQESEEKQKRKKERIRVSLSLSIAVLRDFGVSLFQIARIDTMRNTRSCFIYFTFARIRILPVAFYGSTSGPHCEFASNVTGRALVARETSRNGFTRAAYASQSVEGGRSNEKGAGQSRKAGRAGGREGT
jgi:hypothetical protein